MKKKLMVIPIIAILLSVTLQPIANILNSSYANNLNKTIAINDNSIITTIDDTNRQSIGIKSKLGATEITFDNNKIPIGKWVNGRLEITGYGHKNEAGEVIDNATGQKAVFDSETNTYTPPTTDAPPITVPGTAQNDMVNDNNMATSSEQEMTVEEMFGKITDIYTSDDNISKGDTLVALYSAVAGSDAKNSIGGFADTVIIGPMKSFALWIGENIWGAAGMLWQGATGEGIPTIDDIIFNKTKTLNANVFALMDSSTSDNYANTPIAKINDVVRYLYNMLVAIALGIMFIILILTVIKIGTTSIAQDKADYKKMLTSWVIGLIMILGMPIAVSLMFGINETLVSTLYNSYKDEVTKTMEASNKTVVSYLNNSSQDKITVDGKEVSKSEAVSNIQSKLNERPDSIVTLVPKEKAVAASETGKGIKTLGKIIGGAAAVIGVILAVPTGGLSLVAVGAAAGVGVLGGNAAASLLIELFNKGLIAFIVPRYI